MFVKFSRATKDNVVLLILDGHSTHTKNLQVIDFARDNGVVMLCLPPHASHRLQPLDVSLMKPISSYYEEETRKWLRSHPGKVITLWQVASIFGSAFLSAANMRTAMQGFEATGIWPVNMDVFTSADFLPSEPTNIPQNNEPSTSNSQTSCDVLSIPLTTDLNSPTTSKLTVSTSFPNVSPRDLIEIPKALKREKRRVTRKKGRAVVLTSSPYKIELETAIEMSKRKAEEKEEKARKKLKFSKRNKIGKMKKPCEKKKQREQEEEKHETINTSEEDDSDAKCLYCSDLYSTSTEGWVACASCHKWAHNSCADVDSDDDDPHICRHCVAKE